MACSISLVLIAMALVDAGADLGGDLVVQLACGVGGNVQEGHVEIHMVDTILLVHRTAYPGNHGPGGLEESPVAQSVDWVAGNGKGMAVVYEEAADAGSLAAEVPAVQVPVSGWPVS